jgi:hypothetical protein
MPGLMRFLRDEPTLPFDHILVHGPAKRLGVNSDDVLRTYLVQLPTRIEGVVVHPETMKDPEVFTDVDGKLILENMDARKASARTVGELESYFVRLPKASLCLDIAHAHQNDPTMGLAHELLDAYGDRLREVHVSSILPSGHHTPLSEADLELFEPVLERCVGVPWILEAPLR